MKKLTLSDRGRGLEEEFFARENAKLAEKLREKEHGQQAQAAMAAASGIEDEAVLRSLMQAGLTPSSVAAVTIIPLIVVAWADGKVDAAERSAVLRAVEETTKLKPGDHGYELLEHWLQHEPGPQLRDLWAEYVDAMVKEMAPGDRATFRDTVMERSRGVAAAAGGILGLGSKISAREEAALAELAAKFDSTP